MPMYYNGGGKRSTRRGEGAGLSLPLLLALAVLALLVGASPPARVPTPRPVVSRDPGRSPPTRAPPLTLPRSRSVPQVEEEAIDLTCKPEFTEVNEGTTALRMLLLVEQT